MIELKEEHVRQAFKEAKSDEVKKMLKELFPGIVKELEKKKPTLDDYTSITSYEDACEALRVPPIFSSDYVRSLCGKEGKVEFYIYGCEKENIEWQMLIDRLPRHIIALMKLETISRALWGRNWQPKPDAEGSKTFYWPCFYLLTKKEVEGMTIQQTGALLSANADSGALAGFGCLAAPYRSSDSNAAVGFRLCQETDEKAKYFGSRNFIKLWTEYLRFNFVTGDFLIPEQL